MIKTKNKLQQGFAVVELAILVVVMVTVSGIGYWAVSKSRAAVTASPDIASIIPSNGPIGTQINFKPKTKFAGHYAVNVKKVGGDFWRTNVVRLKASTDGQSLTKEDGASWAFPEYPCTRDGSGTPEATCAASAAAGDGSGFKAFPNSSWYFSLTDATNSTGSPITGNTDKIFTVTGAAVVVTPSPNVSPNPSPISTVHPSISGISPQNAKLGQQITINKGSTKFKAGRYLIYFHLPNDASNKIPVGDIQNIDSTGATLTFTLPTNNAAIQYSQETKGSLQVKDADNLYSNSYVFYIKASATTPSVTPSPRISPNPSPSPIITPSPKISPNPSPVSNTYSPDIGSISPTSGPIGTKLKINAAKKFSGHYQLNLKQVGGNLQRNNVVRLKAAADGKTLTNEDGSLWIFPAYPCARDASGKPDLNCANSAVADDGSGYKAHPGSKWDISLTDASNPSGSPITGTKTARFTVSTIASATPSPGVSPAPIVTPTPSQPWYCRYFKLYCPAIPTPTPVPTPIPGVTPTPTTEPSPTPTPVPDKPWYCRVFRVGCPTYNKVFMLGGSIFERLLAGSDVKQRAKNNGWELSYDADGGRTLQGGVKAVQANKEKVKKAAVIVVALGINNQNNTDREFKTNLQLLYNEIREVNSNAKIYWVNYAIYVVPGGADQARKQIIAGKNDVLESFAKQNKVKIIDWIKESTRTDYDPGDGVHPNATGRAHLSKYINQVIGKPNL